ncbi:hypothetical protein [uncultured Roseobacter sp.]|uniref:hypothetical protein n=1 Tax=uncultured Roseobacter sp. TaxID=114847 RepID=UPI002634235C|nr:hypothetical protein [uncultured Roseobacter sp.]
MKTAAIELTCSEHLKAPAGRTRRGLFFLPNPVSVAGRQEVGWQMAAGLKIMGLWRFCGLTPTDHNGSFDMQNKAAARTYSPGRRGLCFHISDAPAPLAQTGLGFARGFPTAAVATGGSADSCAPEFADPGLL